MNVPFRIPSLYADLAEATGLATLEGDSLQLEIQTKDTVIGLLKSKVREICVPVSELRGVVLEAGWFSARLIIRGSKMSTLADIPGCEQGELQLRIARKHRESARDLALEIELKIQEAKLRKME